MVPALSVFRLGNPTVQIKFILHYLLNFILILNTNSPLVITRTYKFRTRADKSDSSSVPHNACLHHAVQLTGEPIQAICFIAAKLPLANKAGIPCYSSCTISIYSATRAGQCSSSPICCTIAVAACCSPWVTNTWRGTRFIFFSHSIICA
jgi:hypothetical protein